MRHTLTFWRSHCCLLATTALIARFPTTAFAATEHTPPTASDSQCAPYELPVSPPRQADTA